MSKEEDKDLFGNQIDYHDGDYYKEIKNSQLKREHWAIFRIGLLIGTIVTLVTVFMLRWSLT